MEAQGSARKRWEQHIANWRQSGKGVLQWCKENNLSSTQFWYWRKKIFSSDEIITMKVSRSSFHELTDTHNCSAGIDILIAGKIIRLHKNFDEATLKACIRMLGD